MQVTSACPLPFNTCAQWKGIVVTLYEDQVYGRPSDLYPLTFDPMRFAESAGTGLKMAEEYERVSLVKPEVFVYQIPPRTTNRAVRASEWDLANPSWRGRMRVVAKGDKCLMKLEDRHSGELFALCPVDAFPGLAVEPVSDSSRYFIIRLQDPSGKHAFVGLGFEDRGDAFDLNVALQDHFKSLKQSKKLAEEEAHPLPHTDYSLKEGQKIKINLGKKAGLGGSHAKPAAAVGLSAGGGLLPPPSSSGGARPINPPPTQQGTEWGDFAAFGTQSTSSSTSSGGGQGDWVQF